MPLSGFNTLSARPRGGVAKVELIPASEYAGGVPPASSVWAFREDRARYSEEQMQAGAGALVPLVRHTLEMECPADPASREAVDKLVATARAEGVVAVVTMASGEVIVAGYSSRFAEAYPLRITGRNVTSGRTPADFPTIALTLQSTY